MDYIIIYLIYILGLVAVIAVFNWVHLKLETLRLKHRLFNDILKSDFDTMKIEIKDFLK